MRISMPRGDIHYVLFSVSIDDELPEIEYDEIYFTVKRKYSDREFLFQKKLSTGQIVKIGNGTYQIKINPEDTNNLQINKSGEYYDFDIEVVYSDIIKDTFFGEFVLTKEVTHSYNEEW